MAARRPDDDDRHSNSAAGNLLRFPGTGTLGHPQVPANLVAHNQMLYEHFRVSEELQMARIKEKYRQEAEDIYDKLAHRFGKPIQADGGFQSPAKLKWLAAEALRPKLFVDEWIAAGGLARFNKGRTSKFDPTVLEKVMEEDCIGFDLRIRHWLASNPRPLFPALPEDSSDSVSPVRDRSIGARDYWSIDDLVKTHRYYVATPDRSAETDDSGSDQSVVFLKETKKKSN